MRADLLRAVAGQQVEATPVMSDAEKTTLITNGGHRGYDGNEWDDDEDARRRRRRGIIAAVVAGVVVLAGMVALLLVLTSGGDQAPPPVTQVQVPAQLVGLSEADARAALTNAGLTVGQVSPGVSSAGDKGKVISTNPAPGTKVDPKATVDLVVGAGPNTIAVPQVIGLTESGAKANLKAQGFTGSINTKQVDSLEPQGRVVSIDPPEGSQAAPDTSVTLGISTGSVTLPDVAGRDEAAARAALTELGISDGDIVTTNVESDDVPAGLVVGTEPGANTRVSAGQEITLKIAVPIPSTVTTPSTTPPTTSSSTPTSASSTP
jgi:serine/threonine-protein kinase